MKRRLTTYLLLITVLIISGCGAAETEQSSLFAQGGNPAISQEIADKTKREIEKMREVDSVRAVSLDKDVYIALTVTGFDRFHLQEIRQNAHKRAKNLEKDGSVHVSTDRKLDMEIADLEKQIRKRSISKSELEKKLKKIEDDMKG